MSNTGLIVGLAVVVIGLIAYFVVLPILNDLNAVSAGIGSDLSTLQNLQAQAQKQTTVTVPAQYLPPNPVVLPTALTGVSAPNQLNLIPSLFPFSAYQVAWNSITKVFSQVKLP